MSTQPIPETAISVEELLALEAQGKKYEVWDGALREKMATGEHGWISIIIGHLLLLSVLPRQLGRVYPADTTYVIQGTRQKLVAAVMPDVSFISAERLTGIDQKDFFHIPPDLAIEVISESERPSEIMAKVTAYLEFGTAEIWTVYPEPQKIVVYRATGNPEIYGVGNVIEMSGALAGLTIEVGQIFKA